MRFRYFLFMKPRFESTKILIVYQALFNTEVIWERWLPAWLLPPWSQVISSVRKLVWTISRVGVRTPFFPSLRPWRGFACSRKLISWYLFAYYQSLVIIRHHHTSNAYAYSWDCDCSDALNRLFWQEKHVLIWERRKCVNCALHHPLD